MKICLVVPVNELILDYDLYPRSSIDTQHAGYIAEALLSGAKLPPIVACSKSKRVADGFHRCRGHLRAFGEDAKIEVEFRDYPSERDLFLDAIRMNAAHGKALDRHDRVHCSIHAKRLRIATDVVAVALHMSAQRYKDLVQERMAISRSTGEAVPLKRTIEHLAGTKLTRGQEDANRKLGGMRQAFFVNQVILLIEQGLVDTEDDRLMERLAALEVALAGFLKKRVRVPQETSHDSG